MERIVELRGLEGVYCSDVVHAYMSCNAEDVQKALEIGIPCTGANVNKERLGITHWMPIPSFDEILEANRDVLQRLK